MSAYRWSWRTNIIGLCLIASFARLSYWQWERHLWKRGLIAQLQERVKVDPVELLSLIPNGDEGWSNLLFRRVKVTGVFDNAHEVTLRNRKLQEVMGVHLLTPLKIEDTNLAVIVDRGFVPLSLASRESRQRFAAPERFSFTGLVKESDEPRFLAPRDPPAGTGHPWVDGWLRPDIGSIARQLPYPVLPVYLEIVETADTKAIEEGIIDSKGSSREEMFFLGAQAKLGQLGDDDIGKGRYPIPVFSTMVPPGRHLGYVFEWGAMAVITALICLIAQLRRPKGGESSLR